LFAGVRWTFICLCADVKKLVADDSVLTEEALLNILRDYNTEQMTSAPLPGGAGNLLVSKYGQVSSNEYLDPSTGKVWTFNHLTRTFGEETDKKQVLGEDIEARRSAVAKALGEYISDLYKANKATLAVYGADNGTLTVCLSAKNVNLSNFWTGSWRSVYTVSASGDVKGTVKCVVHYFEDGNVQLHTNVEHAGKVNVGGSPDATAQELRKLVEGFETGFQNHLEEMYVNMHRNTFKQMRRFLPVNKVKFTWNAAAHSLASEVSNK
jgi:capping protein alpha